MKNSDKITMKEVIKLQRKIIVAWNNKDLQLVTKVSQTAMILHYKQDTYPKE